MNQSLTFMMGEYAAEFPTNRQYAKNHMWGKVNNSTSNCRFGFSSYAVRLLQDVYFLDWTVDPATTVNEGQEIGAIESKKAESSLYSPIAGQLVEFNELLLSDPSHINVSPYCDGWLFEIDGKGTKLLTPDQYLEHLNQVWEVTQRTIKGQLN